MVDKEGVGKRLKKAVRLIPGVGSYQDKESLRQSDKELRMKVSRLLDEHLGAVEWVKTDQAKKGSFGRMKELDDLSRHLEKVSRMIEFESRGYAPVFAEKVVDEAALKRLFEHDRGIWDLVAEIGHGIQAFTEDRSVPEGTEIGHLRERLNQVEKRIKERASVFKGLDE
jgi:hypothetical protein